MFVGIPVLIALGAVFLVIATLWVDNKLCGRWIARKQAKMLLDETPNMTATHLLTTAGPLGSEEVERILRDIHDLPERTP